MVKLIEETKGWIPRIHQMPSISSFQPQLSFNVPGSPGEIPEPRNLIIILNFGPLKCPDEPKRVVCSEFHSPKSGGTFENTPTQIGTECISLVSRCHRAAFWEVS
eukprot:s1717_g14.t1